MQVSGKFIADGSAVNVDCGFIPDYVELYSALGGTELGFKFFRCLSDLAVAGQYGVALANAGDISCPTTAATGITTYDSSAGYVEVPAPDGDGYTKTTVADWAAATNYATGERSTTSVGTVVRPPTHNGRVFELTTDTSTGDSEPSSWDVQPGATVTDGGGNIWTCREERFVRSGAQGFTVGATISTDGELWVFKAEKHDRHGDFGDSADKDPITFE
jgi:hypothetical protein